MRLSPAVVANHTLDSKARDDAQVQSAITPASEECLKIAVDMSNVLFAGCLDPPESHVNRLMDRTWNELLPGGYIRETWECVLWCVAQTESFEETLLHTVNRRYDADTTGAVARQIAGSIYGLSGIP